MAGAIFNDREVATVTRPLIEDLKRHAAAAPLRRYRFCLHRGTEEPVQEMIIAMCRDTRVPPHRHLGKSESFHVIEGVLELRIYGERGEVTERLLLGTPDSGHPFVCRLAPGVWHEVAVLTDFAVVHETTQGPFIGSDLMDSPPWQVARDSSNEQDHDGTR